MMNWNDLLNSDRLRPSNRVKIVDPRNEFESDFGRIIFSPAIRRMHDKTQVFPLTTDDNIHSRLTHSLEVMAIGYSLGLRLSENEEFIQKSGLDKIQVLRQIPIILENICLIHDIGNPPFGHFGEEVIKNYFKKLFSNCNYGLSKQERDDFELFDGNAQGFRVLTKLQVLDDAYGLNLSISTLAAFLKYPNSNAIDTSRLCTKKRGVYQTENEYLRIIATKCGMFVENEFIARHPLSFIMEAADSICYLVMDIEDGFNKNWYDYNFIEEFFSNNETLKSILEKGKTEVKMNNEISKMVKFRINTISYLVSLTLNNFVKNYDLIMNGKYNEELINDDENNVAKDLFRFCKKNIFPKKEIQSLELTGDSILVGLLEYFRKFIFDENDEYVKRAQGMISKSIIKAALIENKMPLDDSISKFNNYIKFRIIVDFISGMTDQYALNFYQKLNGQKIN